MLHSSQFTYIHCTSIHEVRLYKEKLKTNCQWFYGYWLVVLLVSEWSKRCTIASCRSLIKYQFNTCRNIVLHFHWYKKYYNHNTDCCHVTVNGFFVLVRVKWRWENLWPTIQVTIQCDVTLLPTIITGFEVSSSEACLMSGNQKDVICWIQNQHNFYFISYGE